MELHRNRRLIALASLLTGACAPDSPATPPGSFDHGPLDPVAVAGELLSNAPMIGGPFRIAATDDHLWIADSQGDPGLHVLDRGTGALVTSLGRRGDGPHEFASFPQYVEHDRFGRGGIWAFDGSGGRIMYFRTDSLPDAFRSVVTLPRSGGILRAAWL